MYSEHLFIHYFNFAPLARELNNIYDTINMLQIAYHKLHSNNSIISTVLSKISLSDLKSTYHRLLEKFNNLRPHANIRPKRGLINPIGSLYNAAFGLLDAEDGQRLEDAINKLTTNQKNLLTSLNRQMSLSSKIIERFNKTISIVADNQHEIANHVNALQNNHDTFVITSLKLLTLQGIKQQISVDCITLIEFLDELENAIMFAHLNTIHPSIVHTNEIEEMITILQSYYNKHNIISFESVLSYYKLLSTQVFLGNDQITFTIHFPVITPHSYDMYQVIPIPQNNIITYPTTPFALQNKNEMLMTEIRCREIETHSYCPPTSHSADACMKSTLSQKDPTDCSKQHVTLRTSLTQLIENHLIIVPKDRETMTTKCNNQERIIKIPTPILIKLVPECTVTINNKTFDATRQTFRSTPLILPEIEALDIPEMKTKPVNIEDSELSKISDLKHLIKYPETLIPVDIASHSYTALIVILIILATAIIAFIIYRWFGCALLKRKIHIIQTATGLSLPPKENSFPTELQTLQPLATPRVLPPGNTTYPR